LLGRRPDLRYDLALASRILANEGVLDAFGHVSLRHPSDPGRYFLPRARSPQLVEAADVLEFTLDSEPTKPAADKLFAERVIHGCIYAAREDVTAVCHRRPHRSGISSRRRGRRRHPVLGPAR
jgi:HCOMODA/2-hydroxy-3-carboxy-muconic semialdehyde decarboxylase